MKLRDDFKLLNSQFKSGETITDLIKNQIGNHSRVNKFSKKLKYREHNTFIKSNDERINTDLSVNAINTKPFNRNLKQENSPTLNKLNRSKYIQSELIKSEEANISENSSSSLNKTRNFIASLRNNDTLKAPKSAFKKIFNNTAFKS